MGVLRIAKAQLDIGWRQMRRAKGGKDQENGNFRVGSRKNCPVEIQLQVNGRQGRKDEKHGEPLSRKRFGGEKNECGLTERFVCATNDSG